MEPLKVTRADIGRRVYHTTTRRYGTLETVGGIMADVRFSCGRLQLCSKANLRWADEPDSSWLDEDGDDTSTVMAEAEALMLNTFTDADNNTPDSQFDGDGGSFGGGGADGSW